MPKFTLTWRSRLVLGFTAAVASLASAGAVPDAAPSEAALQAIQGAEAKAWVSAERARAEAAYAATPAYEARYRAALDALERHADALPKLSVSDGRMTTLVKDEAHPRGRWGLLDSAKLAAGERAFTPLLDVDALSTAEEENWTFHHSQCGRRQKAGASFSSPRTGVMPRCCGSLTSTPAPL